MSEGGGSTRFCRTSSSTHITQLDVHAVERATPHMYNECITHTTHIHVACMINLPVGAVFVSGRLYRHGVQYDIPPPALISLEISHTETVRHGSQTSACPRRAKETESYSKDCPAWSQGYFLDVKLQHFVRLCFKGPIKRVVLMRP